VSLGFLIGQSIGRWGNFFNREAFGAETDSWLRMGLYSPMTDSVTYHHPTFLYESVWNALGFVLLHFLSKKREYDGQIALGYVVWYGLGRTFIEGLRTDSLYIPGTDLRVSQVLAAVSCIAAAAVLVYFIIKPPAKKLFAQRVENTTEGGNEDE
jgi:phosphatidylglycerol:prolipoprotein diacylglycerol transferase